jgi:hypothetical protein
MASSNKEVTIEDLRGLLSVIHKKPFGLVHKGSISDLEAWIAAGQSEGRGMDWPTIGAQYAWAMMSGRSRITDPVNVRYPSFVIPKAGEFLQRNI